MRISVSSGEKKNELEYLWTTSRYFLDHRRMRDELYLVSRINYVLNGLHDVLRKIRHKNDILYGSRARLNGFPFKIKRSA